MAMNQPAGEPQTPLRRTPLARLVDAAARARTSTRSLSTVTMGSVVRLVALLAVMVFVVLRMFGVSVRGAGGCVCIFVGVTLGWTQMTIIMNAADEGRTRPTAASVAMTVASVVVTVAGVVQVCASLMPWMYVLRGLLGGVILIAALSLIVAPWWLSLVSNLGEERARAAQEELRADYATQLHDSVLQTLALIQMDADDPVKTRALARSQERDLREWLYGDPGAVLGGPGRADQSDAGRGEADLAETGTAQSESGHASQEGTQAIPTTLSRAVKVAAARVEDTLEIPIDVVVVGDCAMTPTLVGMVSAAAEAMRNAARHGAPPISVYAEVEGAQVEGAQVGDAAGGTEDAATGGITVEIFVRDHGEGFDPEHLPAGHSGVKDSIMERMRRLGGTAVIDSRPGWGTEVHVVCKAS